MNLVGYDEKAQAPLGHQQFYKSTPSSQAKSMIGQLTGLLIKWRQRDIKTISIYPNFFQDSDGVPPANNDAKIRMQYKEVNLCHDTNAFLHKWNEPEVVKLLLAVVDCYRSTKLRNLTEKRDRLRHTIALANITDERQTAEKKPLLQKLLGIEEEITKTNYVIPAALPKEIVNLIVSRAKRNLDDQNLTHKLLRLRTAENSLQSYPRLSTGDWLEILDSAHNILTEADWEYISKHVVKGTKAVNLCKLFWIHHLKPTVNRVPWSKEELQRLGQIVREVGAYGRWEEVARRLGNNRTPLFCFQAWNDRLNDKNPRRLPWTAAEDSALLDLIAQELKQHPISLIDWGTVSAQHRTRSLNECEARAQEICTFFPDSNPQHLQRATKEFTCAEDLALLMAVQRFGVCGGTRGRGSGLGVGSWAVVATELSGRTAAACERRYNVLCEQFQPWTYAEDRALFQTLVQLGIRYHEKASLPNPNMFLSYFPGRSASSLKKRMSDLFHWAQIHHLFRKHLHNALEMNSDFIEKADLESLPDVKFGEIRRMFFASSFLTNFVRELTSRGVTNPEAKAFSLLCSWKPSGELNLPDIPPGEENEGNREFLQLLIDLENHRLFPQPESSVPADPVATTSPGFTLSLATGVDDTPSSKQTSRALRMFQIQSALQPSLRMAISRYLSLHKLQAAGQPPSTHQHRRALQLPTRQRENAMLAFPECARFLLNNEAAFWHHLELTLSDPGLSAFISANKHTIHTLQVLAPEIAQEMIFNAIDTLYAPPLDCAAGGQRRRPTSGKKLAVVVSLATRKRLVKIRRLLMHSRAEDGLKPTLYTFKYHPRSKMKRKYPFTSRLPLEAEAEWIDTAAASSDNLAAYVAQTLGISKMPVERVKQREHFNLLEHAAPDTEPLLSATVTQPEEDVVTTVQSPSTDIALLQPGPLVQLPDCRCHNLLPPNTTTLQAFKTLLVWASKMPKNAEQLPELFLGNRKNLESPSTVSEGSVLLPQLKHFKWLVQNSPTVALTWSSPQFQRLLTTCFTLFLWPCILANLPAYPMVDEATKRIALTKLSLNVAPPKKIKRVPIPGYLYEEMEEFSKTGTHRGSKRRRLEVASLLETSKDWVTLTVPLNVEASSASLKPKLLDISLPSAVQSLINAGFVPTDIHF
ncbi:Myblike DNAbinding domain-containing protein [Sparganum proliferum]